MTVALRSYVAAFGDPEAAVVAARRLREAGFGLSDALTPFPIPELSDDVGAASGPLRLVMAAAGFATALLFVAMQAYSQAIAYPMNSGGRPLASWPIYVLVPFETGVLAAAIAGLAFFLRRAGLPRLHHPLFDVPGVERATQDHFVLVVTSPEVEAGRLRELLFETGALSVGGTGP